MSIQYFKRGLQNLNFSYPGFFSMKALKRARLFLSDREGRYNLKKTLYMRFIILYLCSLKGWAKYDIKWEPLAGKHVKLNYLPQGFTTRIDE